MYSSCVDTTAALEYSRSELEHLEADSRANAVIVQDAASRKVPVMADGVGIHASRSQRCSGSQSRMATPAIGFDDSHGAFGTKAFPDRCGPMHCRSDLGGTCPDNDNDCMCVAHGPQRRGIS